MRPWILLGYNLGLNLPTLGTSKPSEVDPYTLKNDVLILGGFGS